MILSGGERAPWLMCLLTCQCDSFSLQEQPLIHVINVFRRVGYTQGGQLDNWDVLWSHEYPFLSLPSSLWAGLKPQQKVNHFPGSGCFTFKPRLATMEFEFIPKAFQLPKQTQDLLKEVRVLYTVYVTVSDCWFSMLDTVSGACNDSTSPSFHRLPPPTHTHSCTLGQSSP